MFCKNCSKQLDNNQKFCSQCGASCSETSEQLKVANTAQTNNSSASYQQSSIEPSSSKIFMEQLGTLSKTGTQVIKQVATQTQAKAGELSQSVAQSQSLKQLGEKKNLFIFVCSALVVNLILLLSKTIYIELMSSSGKTFSVIGFCSEMLGFINKIGKYTNGVTDAPFYMAVKFLEIIAIILILASIVKTTLPIFTSNTSKPISFKLIKISAIYSVVLTFVFMFFCTIGLGSQKSIEFHLTFLGWLYVIESVVLIISVFKLLPKVKRI